MPDTLLFAFAKLIDFYRTDMPNDDKAICEFMKTASVEDILKKEDFWGTDLLFLKDEVLKYVNK